MSPTTTGTSSRLARSCSTIGADSSIPVTGTPRSTSGTATRPVPMASSSAGPSPARSARNATAGSSTSGANMNADVSSYASAVSASHRSLLVIPPASPTTARPGDPIVPRRGRSGRPDVGQAPDDVRAQPLGEGHGVGGRRAQPHLVDAQAGVGLHLAEELVAERVVAHDHGAGHRGRVAADVRAVPVEHPELVPDDVGALVEEVAGVRVLRDQPERLALAGAADQDPRPVLADRRDVDRLDELVVLALVRGLVVAPHPLDDLQRLLETLEPLGRRRV